VRQMEPPADSPVTASLDTPDPVRPQWACASSLGSWLPCAVTAANISACPTGLHASGVELYLPCPGLPWHQVWHLQQGPGQLNLSGIRLGVPVAA
jgi:hypothetical protein